MFPESRISPVNSRTSSSERSGRGRMYLIPERAEIVSPSCLRYRTIGPSLHGRVKAPMCAPVRVLEPPQEGLVSCPAVKFS